MVHGLSPIKDTPSRNLILFFEKSFSNKQKKVVFTLSNFSFKNQTMTSLVREISDKTRISEPTVRRTFQKLRNLGIIKCGDENNKGIEVEFTNFGFLLLSILYRGYGEMSSHKAPDLELGVQFPLTPSFILKK